MKDFYLASRRVRSRNRTALGCDIHKNALETMMQLATCHAVLNLRLEVLKVDAVIAIMLYEESLTSQSGFSVLNFRTRTTPWRPASQVVDNYLEQISVMEKQIARFCVLSM
eukprot:m.15877 g.15877  ORF g.15877 m.15877 type:complete len:111 (-) comp10049_c0_seq2:37-369(-)